MNRMLLTGNEAVAWGARLGEVEYVPAFPITPQTEIIERLAQWIDRGEIDTCMVTMDSEHSMLTAAGTAAATGVRALAATSSQGLLYAMEMLYTVAGWRVPFVLVNVSRGLSAPITLEPDHNDVLAARDAGFCQLHASTCQEVLDAMLLAIRVSEDARVRLPVIVNLDGFYLSFTREPVNLPGRDQVRAFLPPFDPQASFFRGGTPQSQGVAVLGGSQYSYFRYETHLASLEAGRVFAEAAADFERHFGRLHRAVETFRCDDAEFAFVMMGSFSTKAKAAVQRLREAGWKIGLVRPFLLRPFPEKELVAALSKLSGVAVIDQNLSPGMGGVLASEIGGALYRAGGKGPVLVSVIGGLGGRDIAFEEFVEIARMTRDAADRGQSPPPRLLFTQQELEHTRKLQEIARASGLSA